MLLSQKLMCATFRLLNLIAHQFKSGIQYSLETKRNDDIVPLIESPSSLPVNREWSLQLSVRSPDSMTIC
jgi:hypothetical protein